MKARIEIRLKHGVLDPQGKAVEQALHGLGFDGVTDVRIGKLIEFEVQGGSTEVVRDQVATMCERLLANTVIESYRIQLETP